MSPDALRTAMGVFRPELYDAVLGSSRHDTGQNRIGAFVGPPFDANDIVGHLSAFAIGRWKA